MQIENGAEQAPKGLVILGSTGVVGKQSLAIAKRFPGYAIVGLAAYQSVESLWEQIVDNHPTAVVLIDPVAADTLQHLVRAASLPTEVWIGQEGLVRLVTQASVTTVVAAMAGVSSMGAVVAALRSGKRVCLANKESLVVGGRWIMDALHRGSGSLLPLDSEHAALYQLLPESLRTPLGKRTLASAGVKQLYLMASGGPFWGRSWNELQHVTQEMACSHPKWRMGKKISVDSATLMNKGLEYIEARWLFRAEREDITLLAHPQAQVHGIIQLDDNQFFLHASATEMSVPIAFSLAYPERALPSANALPFAIGKLPPWEFTQIEAEAWPCLQWALLAAEGNDGLPILLHVANERAVQLFLQGRIRFTAIASYIEEVLQRVDPPLPGNLEEAILCVEELTTRLLHAGWERNL